MEWIKNKTKQKNRQKKVMLGKPRYTSFAAEGLRGLNTRICNLISVPKIMRLLLGDAIILSKTDANSKNRDCKKEKRSYGKIKNNKAMSILKCCRLF